VYEFTNSYDSNGKTSLHLGSEENGKKFTLLKGGYSKLYSIANYIKKILLSVKNVFVNLSEAF
jgi:hypothetical protein